MCVPDVDIAEAIGLRLGLTFARDLSFMNLIGETDSLNVATSIKAPVQAPSYFGSIISD